MPNVTSVRNEFSVYFILWHKAFSIRQKNDEQPQADKTENERVFNGYSIDREREAGASFVLDRCLLIGQLLLLQFQVERLKLLEDLLLITRVRIQEGRNGVEWNKHRRGSSSRGRCTDR